MIFRCHVYGGYKQSAGAGIRIRGFEAYLQTKSVFVQDLRRQRLRYFIASRDGCP